MVVHGGGQRLPGVSVEVPHPMSNREKTLKNTLVSRKKIADRINIVNDRTAAVRLCQASIVVQEADQVKISHSSHRWARCDYCVPVNVDICYGESQPAPAV